MQHSTPTTAVYIENILKIKYICIVSKFEIQMALWHVSGVWILSDVIYEFYHLFCSVDHLKCFCIWAIDKNKKQY